MKADKLGDCASVAVELPSGHFEGPIKKKHLSWKLPGNKFLLGLTVKSNIPLVNNTLHTLDMSIYSPSDRRIGQITGRTGKNIPPYLVQSSLASKS